MMLNGVGRLCYLAGDGVERGGGGGELFYFKLARRRPPRVKGEGTETYTK